MRIIRISVVILFSVFFIAIVTPSHAFDATEQNIAILDDKIERLEDDVSIWKTEVQKLEDRARRYDRMANDAKKEAEKSKQQADKDHWIESAKKRSERVNNLREDIKNISGKIEKAENEIRTLKGEKNQKVKAQQGQQVQSDKTAKEHADKKREIKESTRNEDTCQLQYPEELFGLWHYDDDTDSNPLAIVQEDPEVNAYPNRLELHNHDRIWKGTFNSSKDLRKDKPRMVFKYKPKVEEVNENLPDWVAAGLEGQLEWEMEIWTECDHGIAMPHALFYPGKIEWDEEAKTYDIVGRGEGRRFDLNPVSHMTLESYANAAIGISVDKTQDPFIRPIEALTKRQRFNVVVRLPADMAEEVGKTIEVQLKGLENGDTDILELKAGRSSGNNPVLYQHGKPITIADSRDWRENPRRQKFLSLNYLFGDAGDMMDLDVENEEVVEFSYKDLKFEVPVYQTHYQRGHARFQQAAERMDAFYGSVLYGENTEEQKQRARTKLRMLFNYKKIISSEYINDRHRYNIGEVYFGDAFGSYG
ncbi:MAG: hypothetical protein MRY79_03000, partial [Alphaproteobacteria bacterium]|nr:hypothetical protein [Alphaproteobacteria bacterium]